ncbi:Hsp70 family protein [Microbacterium sp.]|uniref:Hsp70 family protein n=1 Tax=Microbacterium sp. TaxID=51671 RepID=UPI003A90B33F
MSEPSFLLAIDAGNSRVSAAVAHGSRESYDNPALFSLGANEHSAPSAVFVAEDETLFFGEEATRRGATAPHRLVREFAHDVGNGVRLLIGEHAVSADDLVARLCAWVVDQVTEAEGEQPAVIAITHPTTWGGHRLSRLRGALQRAGIDAPILLSESEASARQSETALPLDPGHMLAVYDLGGTRFDARVLRQRSGGRYQPVGDQVSIEHLGGASFDDELMRHVLSVQGSDVADAPLTALVDVRSAVVEAKELLSSAGDATVRLGALAGGASVRITRSELEGMIAADLDRTVEALDLAIESADAHGDRLKGIVLAGGSSRTPLVAQRLSERFDVQIVADADTKAATALGAARIACDLTYGTGAATETKPAPAPAPAPAPSARTSRAVEPKSVTPQSVTPKPAENERTPEQDQPGENPSQEKTRAAAFLQTLFAKPSRTTSPALLAVAAVFIAATIVLSNTTAAGTRWPDFVAHAASTLMSLPKPLGGAPTKPTPDPAAAAPATPQVPATESVIRPVSELKSDAGSKQAAPKTRQSGPKVEPTSPSNDSGGSTGAAPTTPGSTDAGTGTTPGGQTGTTQPPADTSDPDDTGGTTTTPPPETTPTDPIPDTTPQDPAPEDTAPDGSNPTDPTAPPADTTPPAEDPAPVSPTPVAETPLAETAPTAGEQHSGPVATPT